jgi:hypothetical protein
MQLALAGDPDAEHRVREVAAADHAGEMDAAMALLGLAQVAWQRKRYDDVLRYADGVIQAAGRLSPHPQPRVMFRVAAAVLHLQVAEIRADQPRADQPRVDQAGRPAADILRLARDEVVGSHDSPMVGSWALGGAELAAFHGDAESARELWSLSMRVGATVGRIFPQGQGQRLTVALADDREPLLAGSSRLTVTEALTRIREVMDRVLA